MTLARQSSRRLAIAIHVVRFIIGALFVLSGIAKLIDLWGTVFKIEDYLAVWSVDVPRTIVFIGSLSLSMFEFASGALLLMGCYRRVIPWLLLWCMSMMLPLTLYIWIKNPVEDCGCFGDLWKISNFATFLKNIFITAGVLFLVKFNRRAACWMSPAIQWIVVLLLVAYGFVVSLWGYNVQPMIDFRPFASGTTILPVNDDEDDVRFLYTNGSETREFSASELPDDDRWTFVDRVQSGTTAPVASLSIYDSETGDDVTEDIIAETDSLLLVIVPEPSRANPANTFAVNELVSAVSSRGGRVVGLLAAGAEGIERWRDNSMADYPCYQADDTELKQLARGLTSAVWIAGDTIRWKRTVSSLMSEDIASVASGAMSMEALSPRGEHRFVMLTSVLVAMLALIGLSQTLIITIVKRSRAKKIAR